ncbi:MAG: S8 family serine peptidase [Flavobacteriales bacterium]|nr:S8 family serine peptidase [Flavobacteriales bacterium]
MSFRPLLLSLALVAQVPFLSAQSEPLRLHSGLVAVPSILAHPNLLRLERSDGHWQGRAIRALQFDHTLNAAERARLGTLGLVLLDPLRPHAWMVSAPIGTDLAPLQAIGLIGVLQLTAELKLAPQLAKALSENDPRVQHDVVFVPWPGVNATELGEVLRASIDAQGTLHARADRAAILRMAGHAAVQWVSNEPEEGKPESLRGRTYHRVHGIGPGVIGGPGLDGSGVTVVVNDDGFVGPHIDFKGRTSQDDVLGDLTGTHGDMCAGIVAGAGNIDPSTAGMAPGADLIIRQYDGDLPDTEILHQLSGAVIFSSSYSNGCNAGYTETTQRVDQEVVDNPSILQVFSAGNEGQNDCGYGAGTGWGTISGGHKIGKHVIATANMTDTDQLVASSSRGPSADGRIKPDIAAFGNGHISTAPDNGYLTGSGTSAAAPGIAGTAALLYQAWRDQFGNDPPSALIKADPPEHRR